MDLINYSNFSASGVTVADTFNTWRQKSNGTISRLNDIITDVDALYNADRTAIRYATTDSPQSITGTKTFSGGTVSSPILKIDSAGLYYDSTDSSIASTAPLKASKLINAGTDIQLGNNTYTVPTSNPSELSLLSKNGVALGWTQYSSLISQIKDEASVNVVTSNIVLPVGTIQAYSSATSVPTGWLACTGGRFQGSTHPELAALLLATYGPVYTTESGSTPAPNQTSYVAANWYTLPDMRGRVTVGSGTGVDAINASQTFMLGTRGGKFSHTLITAELPSHTHTMDSAGAHTHQFNLQTTNNYDSFIAFGRNDINSEIPNDGTGYTFGTSGGGGNDRVITMASAGAHTHTINSTGSGAAHTIMQPYLVTNYIIKAKPDNVITSQILVGSGINVVRNGSDQTFISLSDTTNSTLSVKHDSTLRINIGDSSLGLNSNSVNNSNLVNGAVSPEKLSTNGPSWGVEGAEVALYEGSGSSRKRVATREWVNDIVVDGPVKSLVTKNPGQRHTSAMVQYSDGIYAYIDKDGVPCIAGHHTYNALAPFVSAGGYTPYPLPLDNGREITVEKLWVTHERIIALGSNGKLYARGINDNNEMNISSFIAGSSTRYSNWVLAFDPVYSYLGQSRTIKSVIFTTDLEDHNIAVIDSTDALWIAGYNQYGALGNGTTIGTESKTPNRYEAAPILTNVKEVVMMGSWDGGSHILTVAAIRWTNPERTSAEVRTWGYGGYGLMGDGTTVAVNSTPRTVTLPSGVNPVNYELYTGGTDWICTICLVASDGSVAYGWGSNSDCGLGIAAQNIISLPAKIWDATSAGPASQRDRFIEKFYTTSHSRGTNCTYILTKPVPSTNKKEIWAAGYNHENKFGDAMNINTPAIWRNITPANRPSNWSVDDFYVGNSFNWATNNFIRWKIVNNDGDVYQLEASGWSGDSNTGTGLNSGPLTTWTRVNLRSETVKTIVDCQTGRCQGAARSFTYLLCNDGSLYFTGITHYQCNPYGLNGYATPNFIRIK